MDANAQMEMMEQHLLFYRAMAEDENEFSRLNGYIEMLRNDTGEKLPNEVDESVRAMFSLVLEKGMDPWAIDLEEFARLYADRISNSRFDMLVAGRLLLMAWMILNMQSLQTRMNADTPEEPEEFIDAGDFDFIDESAVIVPDVSLTKAFAHVTPRPVTMYDLIGALEDAKKEADAYEERRKILALKPRPEPAKFDNKAHKEDDETVVERIYQMIYNMGMDPMPITEFYTGSKEENISVFVSVLHLVRDGKLEISQETLPYGEILVQIKQPASAEPLEVLAVN